MEAAASGACRREREIFQLIAEGKANKEIATLLSISVSTAEAHRARVMELDLHNAAEIVLSAVRRGIIRGRGAPADAARSTTPKPVLTWPCGALTLRAQPLSSHTVRPRRIPLPLHSRRSSLRASSAGLWVEEEIRV